MHFDKRKSIRTLCAIVNNIRIKRYSKRSRCNWFNIYRNLSFANRTKNQELYFCLASTFLCNTYPISYWQRRLYLLCRDADLRSSKWCKTIYNDAKHLCKWTTTLPGRLRNFGRIDLPKSTPNSWAIYKTTNKPKTRIPVQSTCRCRCRQLS
jgi:hypothetical protein